MTINYLSFSKEALKKLFLLDKVCSKNTQGFEIGEYYTMAGAQKVGLIQYTLILTKARQYQLINKIHAFTAFNNSKSKQFLFDKIKIIRFVLVFFSVDNLNVAYLFL